MKNSRKNSGWTIEYSRRAVRDLKKIPKAKAKEIIAKLEEIVLVGQDPYSDGKPLAGAMKGMWAYRAGRNFRIICEIINKELRVLVLSAADRKDVYR